MAVLKVYDGTSFIEIPTGVLDSVLVGYSPAVLANWDSSLDPGEVDDALDQLAKRAKANADDHPTSTDNAVGRFNGTSGVLQNSGVLINDSDVMSGGRIADAMVIEGNVTQHEAAIDHDALTNFLAIEHQKPRCAITYSDPTARTADASAKVGNVQMNADEGFVMPWAGSILAHSLSVEIQTATSGDVTFQARINDVSQASLELEILSSAGTGKKRERVTVSSGSVTFAAGDFINARADETGTMGWDDLIGTIWVEFDA